MSSPIPPYTMPHAGPSNYYAQSGPASPHFSPYASGSSSPVPGNPNFVYPYPMNHHLPQHGPPIRANGRGGHASPSRGGHFHHGHPQQFPHGQPIPPNPLQSPQATNFPPHKFAQNYPVQYPYHPHPGHINHSPVWQSQPSAISPLPKQLSMPPPRTPSPSHSSGYPPTASYTPEGQLLSPLSPASSNPASSPIQSRAHVRTHSNQSVTSTTASSSPGFSSIALDAPADTWVIWKRRPHDPSQAPGIIFSTHAKPPPNIIARAMDVPCPPPPHSPVEPGPAEPTQPGVEQSAPAPVQKVEEKTEELIAATEGPEQEIESFSTSNSTVPSSSVTETTDTPTLPGSPVSTNTSVSISGTPSKDREELTSELPEVVDALQSGTSATSLQAVEPEIIAETPKPAAPPAKKSWASLLRQPPLTGASSSTGPARNSLPTSSVVGISIQAGLEASSVSTASAGPNTPYSGLPPVKRSSLVSLLSNAPPSSSTVADIRPRGLVNTGNMCFANSVLQVLTYCPPFASLFHELGTVFPKAKGKEAKVASPTPLVDATIDFLREFLPSKEDGGKGSGNGSPPKVALKDYVVKKKGKGKDVDAGQKTPEDEDDWGQDSFIPTSVYDALKEKKRFDHMRGGHQEDAEEFFGFYLDTLEEELLSMLNYLAPGRPTTRTVPVEEKEEEAPPPDDGWLEVGKRNRMVVTRTIKTTESPISRVFGGKFRSTLRAPQQKDSVIVEDWRSLRLDIQREQVHTVQDALACISHAQSIQMSNPSRPGIVVEASQQVLIDALPPVLVLHMKRFCYDVNVGGVVKVGKQVRFGPELEIAADIMSTPARKQNPAGAKYKLFGAVYHHGVSASGGHYTLDVLHPNRFPSSNHAVTRPREGWIRIDDELVSDVRPEDVFDAYERDETRCAYLLFYRRVQ